MNIRLNMKICFISLLSLPFLLYANMNQSYIDNQYNEPIILLGKKSTININLPVDSISGYRWILYDYDYDFIKPVSYEHEKVNISKSRYGALDKFKMMLNPRFKKVPQKIVLHFECLNPWDNTAKKYHKDITIIYLK